MTPEELRTRKEAILLAVDGLLNDMIDHGYFEDDTKDPVIDSMVALVFDLEENLETNSEAIIRERL